MAIDFVIPGTSLLDQLATTTLDGLANNDARDNCVGTSVAEALHILTGATFDGDEVKDAVYGAGYIGTESAAHYVSYCAAHGVHLAAHNGSQADLIATLHAQVDAHHPVILTMPSDWNTAPANPLAPAGSTHVGVAVGTGPGEIRVMNPWHGFYQDATDQWWQARLCYGQVWIAERGANMVPNGWHDDGSVLTAPNGKTCVRGIRAAVLAEAHDPTDVPIDEEFSVPVVEYGNTSLGAGVVQFFEKSGQISWTAARGTFRTWNGQEENALRTILQNTLAALKQAQSAPAPAPAPVTPPIDPAIAAKAAALDALMKLYGI